LQNGPILKGDWVVFTLHPHTIQAVHIPTRTLTTLRDADLMSFDGVRTASRPLPFATHEVLIDDVVAATSSSIQTPSMAGYWDFRDVRISETRLLWGGMNTNYTQETLYSVSLGNGSETQVAGPESIRFTSVDGDRAIFVVPASNGFRNLLFDPAIGASEDLVALNPLGAVVSWHEPWVALQGTPGWTVANRMSGETRKVSAKYDSIVQVGVSAAAYAGHARNGFGSEGEVFLVALDGSFDRREKLDSNDFVAPSMDGTRVVYADHGDIWLLEPSP
jgi:hypothetical protein